jgi:hypothetical protein
MLFTDSLKKIPKFETLRVYTGQTPLIAASERGHEGTVTTLLKRGADKSRKTLEGKTALDIARKLGRQSIVTILQPSNETPSQSPIPSSSRQTLAQKEKGVCFWIYTTRNKDTLPENIVTKPFSIDAEKNPQPHLNCFTTKNEAETQLKQTFTSNFASGKGPKKAFIFQIEGTPDTVQTNFPKINFIGHSAYTFDRDENTLQLSPPAPETSSRQLAL